MIHVSLPDGTTRAVKPGATAAELASNISKSLAFFACLRPIKSLMSCIATRFADLTLGKQSLWDARRTMFAVDEESLQISGKGVVQVGLLGRNEVSLTMRPCAGQWTIPRKSGPTQNERGCHEDI